MPSWIGQVSPLKHGNSIVQTFSPQISSYKGSYSLSYNYITTEPGLYKMKHSNSKNMPMDVKQLSPKHGFLKVWRKFYPITFNTQICMFGVSSPVDREPTNQTCVKRIYETWPEDGPHSPYPF